MVRKLRRAFWSAVLAGIWNVVLCSAVNLVLWRFRYYTSATGIVWMSDAETLLWRGALVGVIVGWRPLRAVASVFASALGGVVLAMLLSIWWIAFGTHHLPYAIDTPVSLHFIINGLLVGVPTNLVIGRILSERKEEVASC
jgi:hypothetical protein